MAIYRVDIEFDMGMSRGKDTHRFKASDDDEAKAYLEQNEGGDLGDLRRDVSFDRSTLSRAVE